MNIEEIASQISEKELERLLENFNEKQKKITIYRYSKITDADLDKIVNIKKI